MEMSEKKRKTEEEVKKLSWIAMGQLEKATIYYLLMFVQFVEALESRKVDISPYRPESLFILVNQLRVLLLRKKECYSLYWKDLDQEVLFSRKFYNNYEKLIVEIRKKNKRYQGQYPWDRILDELKRYKEYQILKKELEEEDQSLSPPSALMTKLDRSKSTPFIEKRNPTPFIEKRNPATKKRSVEYTKSSSWTKPSEGDKQSIQPKPVKSTKGSPWKKVEEDRKQSMQKKKVENSKVSSVSSWTKFGEDEKRNTQKIKDEKQKSSIEIEKPPIESEKTPLWKKFIKDRGFSKSLEQGNIQKQEPTNQKEQPEPKQTEKPKIAYPTDHRKKEINWSRTGIRIFLNHKS